MAFLAVMEVGFVGEWPVNTPSYPFLAVLSFEKSRRRASFVHDASGSLIAPRWVLTAAHAAARPFVRLGQRELSQPGGEILGLEGPPAIHPDYRPATGEHDLALLRLEAPSRHPPVELARDPSWRLASPASPHLLTASWGKAGKLGFDGFLRERTVGLASATAGGEFAVVSPSSSADEGDSGGPILWRQPSGHLVQVGVVSRSHRRIGEVDRIVDIASHWAWIDEVTRGDVRRARPYRSS